MDNGEENRLKQFRIHMNMTQQQMADLLKVGQNTYSRIENGVTAFKDVYKKNISENEKKHREHNNRNDDVSNKSGDQ